VTGRRALLLLGAAACGAALALVLAGETAAQSIPPDFPLVRAAPPAENGPSAAGGGGGGGGFSLPVKITLGGDGAPGGGDDLATGVKIVLLLTLLTLAPAVILTVTSFTRIVIVLSFAKRALSVQELPPNQVVIGLALFLTLAVMHPVLGKVYSNAVTPYMEGKASALQAGAAATEELRGFLLRQTREKDVALMVSISGVERPGTPRDLPVHLLVGSFVLSELKTAFQMGFVIFLPFLVIDLVVSGVLLSMGMFMLPPALISTPFKILLFVLVDGWNLLVQSLFLSFR